MVKTHFLLENLSISDPSLGILQNFQKLKTQLKKKILIGLNVKTLKCIFWPCRILKYFLDFTQGEYVALVRKFELNLNTIREDHSVRIDP